MLVLYILTLLLSAGLLLALTYIYGLLMRERGKVERSALREGEQRERIGDLAAQNDDLQERVRARTKLWEEVVIERDTLQAGLETQLQINEELQEKVNDLQAMNTALSSAEPEPVKTKPRTRRKVV